jgi:O-antigen/teichoic acid export membrane protein
MSPRRLAANAVSNTLGLVAQLVVSFFLAPVVLAALGDDRNGLWRFVESFLAYLMLFDLGVAAALVRFVPRCLAGKDYAGLNRIFSACLAFFAAVAAVAGTCGWLVLTLFADYFLTIPPELRVEVHLIFLVVAANFAVTLPLSIFPAMLDGLNAFTAKSTTRTAFLVLRVPAMLFALLGQHRLLHLILVLSLSNLLESLTLAWLVYRWLPGLRFAPWQIDRATVRMIRGYSLDSFLAMMAGRLSFQTDAFVIATALNWAAINPFDFANQLVDRAKSVLRAVTTTLTPVVSSLEAQGDLAGVRTYFLHGTRIVLYLVLPIQAGLYVLGRPFFLLWLKDRPDIAEASAKVLWVLASTLSLTIAQSVASRVLYGMGHIRLFARVALLEGVTNVLLSLALVGPLGIVGVAWGTAIPHAAFCLFVITHAATLLGVRLSEYARAWVTPLSATALLTCLFLLQATPNTWGTFVLVGLVATVPYALVVIGLEWHPQFGIWLVSRFRQLPLVKNR